MSDRQGTLAEAIRVAVESAQRSMLGWLPAKVVKFDGKNKVDCQILVKDSWVDEVGDRQSDSFAVVPSVPVAYFGAGIMLTVPISAGNGGKAATTGILLFAGRSLDKWLSGSGGEVDPELDHDHALTDAVFIPGLLPFGGSPQSIATDVAVVAETIANAQFVAQANKVKQWLDAFVAAVNGWTPVANDGGAALKTALNTILGGNPSTDVAASKLKAE